MSALIAAAFELGARYQCPVHYVAFDTQSPKTGRWGHRDGEGWCVWAGPDPLKDEGATPMTLTDRQVEELRKDLEVERVKQLKEGPSAGASYLEGYDVIAKANEIFGFDGWSMRPPEVSVNPSGLVTAYVTIDVAGVTRSDVGIGVTANRAGTEPKPSHWEMAIKGAVTDGLKRAFRTFGNQFGNSLYDKESELHAAAHEAANAGTRGRGTSIPAQAPAAQPVAPKRFCAVEGHGEIPLIFSKKTQVWGHVLADGSPCIAAPQEAKA